LLRKYEEGLLMMDVPLLDCPQQDKRMSDYTFETGKMTPDEYQTIHNGPDFTEVTNAQLDSVIKRTGAFVRNFEKIQKSYQDPVLGAWLEIISTLKRYQI